MAGLPLKRQQNRRKVNQDILQRHEKNNPSHQHVQAGRKLDEKVLDARLLAVTSSKCMSMRTCQWCRVARVVSAFAAGKVINPKTAGSQAIGGILDGHRPWPVRRNDSRSATPAPLTPTWPTTWCQSTPTCHRSTPSLSKNTTNTPLQSAQKGMAELSLVGIAAIGNAVYHATGKRPRDLPITIEKLM